MYSEKVASAVFTSGETARNSSQGVVEFKTEVNLVAKVQHKNLVRLLCYCVQEPERLLVYEYMGAGSQQINDLKLPHDSLEVYLHTCNILDDDDDTDDELYAYFFV
ncbi:calcium/calmodulin-regulated receptor-like kinase 2 [Helianthus annuus]|uniref:Putative tyrosine-protein kinase, Fes/Fps type n=1 Tax=Helianthus annuus TaxID=4232 RepID=A0A251S925_HELAN|nr:calcium/calmodulin-regulated receptor-like kinase 2 [Helianthus annuus]